MKHATLVIAMVIATTTCAAQMSLTTTYVDNNGCAGAFFDVAATGGSDVTVVGFDTHIDPGAQNVEVWTRPGTHVGFETSAVGWTMIGSFPGLVSAGAGLPTLLPFAPALNLTISAGQRQAFVIATTNGNFTPYTNSVGTVGATVFVSDAFVSIYNGVGQCATSPFLGGLNQNRMWNGTIRYVVDCLGNCMNPVLLSPIAIGLPGQRTTDDSLMVDTAACATDNNTPSCSAGGNDAIVRLVAPFDGTAIVDTCGAATTFDTILSVLDGACGSPELTCANANSCGVGGESVMFNIVAGNTYFIVTDGVGGATGIAELRVRLTEVPTAYVPCPGVRANTLDAANPLSVAVEGISLVAAGLGGGQVAWQPCYQQYYAFQPGSTSGTYEVFDANGLPLASSTTVGLNGRGMWWNPGTGRLELTTINAVTGGSPVQGLFNVGLDASAYYAPPNPQVLASVPGLSGPDATGSLVPLANLVISRSNTDQVYGANRTTGAAVGSIMIDSVTAGSPAFITHCVQYSGVFGHELLVGTPDSVVIFDAVGAYVATVPLGVVVAPGAFSGSYANDLWWVWDQNVASWRSFEIFNSTPSVPCSTGIGADLVLLAGAHTIDTSTGLIDGVLSAGYDIVSAQFNFANIDIQLGATVAVSGTEPLRLLATGDITMAGTINLDGQTAPAGGACGAPGGAGGAGGPGGFAGGEAGGNQRHNGLDGGGPGGGRGGIVDSAGGGGAGHFAAGSPGVSTSTTGTPGAGGVPYATLLPTLVGGSGGGGGSGDDDAVVGVVDPGDDGGGGGGGGGGACLINGAGTVVVSGTINARGGNGAGTGCSGNAGSGGGGSGGTIVIFGAGMPLVPGTLDVSGGLGGTVTHRGGDASLGRVVIGTSPCAFNCMLTTPMQPTSSRVTTTIDAMTGAATYDATFEFSIDAGLTWNTCTAAASSPTPNPATGLVPGTPTAFTWDSAADGVPAQTAGVLMRGNADDGSSLTTCVSPPFTIGCECGDCNLDGMAITILDSLTGAQLAASISPPAPGTPVQLLCCDVDATGTTTILDALRMAQDAAGLPAIINCP